MNLPPQKPWESAGSNIGTNPSFRFALSNVSEQESHSSFQNMPIRPPQLQSSSCQPIANIRTIGPAPPLPPRPNSVHYPLQRQSTYYGSGYGMSPYSSGYNIGNYGGYGGYGSFNGYGGLGGYGLPGLGYGFGRPINPLNDFESRFIQLAEESSRPAFQSIESLVRAFSSISMMLESTFHAMYSSFRAVIGVAENFSRLRHLFTQFFSAIAVLKFAKNYLRRLLYWFGIIPDDPRKEVLWQNALTGETAVAGAPSRATWPIFAFLGLLFGGPYLMSKLLGQSISGAEKENTWNPVTEPGTAVVGLHNFQAASDSEIGFVRGQLLQLAPLHYYNVEASNGWVLAADQQGRVGFIPSNRITRLPPSSTTINTPNIQHTKNTSVPAQSEGKVSSKTETENKIKCDTTEENKVTSQ